jgi:2,5-diketo-D-gluconate reductase A
MLRWHPLEGRSAIPKSVEHERIAVNFDVFDFEPTADELARIDAHCSGVRYRPDPHSITLGSFRLDIPEA